MSILQILQERARQEAAAHREHLQTCVVVDREIGGYTIRFGGQQASALSTLADSLKPGDQVQVLFGKGTPTIIGVLGKDGNAT